MIVTEAYLEDTFDETDTAEIDVQLSWRQGTKWMIFKESWEFQSFYENQSNPVQLNLQLEWSKFKADKSMAIATPASQTWPRSWLLCGRFQRNISRTGLEPRWCWLILPPTCLMRGIQAEQLWRPPSRPTPSPGWGRSHIGISCACWGTPHHSECRGQGDILVLKFTLSQVGKNKFKVYEDTLMLEVK